MPTTSPRIDNPRAPTLQLAAHTARGARRYSRAMPGGVSAAPSCGAGGARLSAAYTAAAPGPVAPARRRLLGCARRRRAALRAAALLALAVALLYAAACARAGAAPRAVGPRRALAFVPVYALLPYAKMLDCFALGLAPLCPAELLQCVAYTTA